METGLDVLVGFDGYCTSECRPALCVLDIYQLREEYTEDYRDILKTTRDILKTTRDILKIYTYLERYMCSDTMHIIIYLHMN